jgi:hypothetical protein
VSNPRHHIAPEALSAIETLEQATSPEALGAAYAMAEREAKRLAPHWGLSTIAPPFSMLAFVVALNAATSPQLPLIVAALMLLSAAMGLHWFLNLQGPRAAACTRVNNAIGRWRHLTPLMRDAPK